ncbi:DUF7115 domain-containing protein [Halovivax gelatinilyticus]|uniref:DUF7115 domain-containing protein n=1 Tax=Halovivax gelatinilyticus TaxID=2961597 RepID=UPI0020CA6BA7|nr:hypothetical protein [Halovivax gelatinilyticus]
MSVPAIVESSLGGAELVEQVPLGGDDELFVSSESTLLYRADGLLSDESVEEFPHDASRLSVSEGRRKARIELEYSIDGTREFKVPAGSVDTVVHPVVAGVLAGNGITNSGERVIQTFRFSELTVIVTSERLVKHIGSAVWDEDYEEFPYEDATGLTFESGSVATQVVVEVNGRQQRIKAPNEQAAVLRERLEQAVFAYHDVDSLDALYEKVGIDDDEETGSPTVDFGEGVDPLTTNAGSDEAAETEDAGAVPDVAVEPTEATTTESRATDGHATPNRDSTTEARTDEPEPTTEASTESARSFEGSGFEPATADADADVLERLDALETTIERQTAILERQQNTIEQLIEELRRGR